MQCWERGGYRQSCVNSHSNSGQDTGKQMSPRHQNTKLGLGGKKKLRKTHKHYDKRSNKKDDHHVSVSWCLQS